MDSNINTNHNLIKTEFESKDGGKHCCNYQGKSCNQRCYKNYSYCFRHILCDKDAPFKQCQFVTHKNGVSNECVNAIVKDNTQLYCTKHLYMMGLKEKKKSSRNSAIKINDAKPISKYYRTMYNYKVHIHNLLNFVKKSIVTEFNYMDNTMEMLYHDIFVESNNNDKGYSCKQYKKILDQSIIDQYKQNLRLELQLNKPTKNISNIIRSYQSNQDVEIMYNTIPQPLSSLSSLSLLLYEHDPTRCCAKIVSNESSQHSKCMNRAIVGANYCSKHMKLNKKQFLFTTCNYKLSSSNGGGGDMCGELVIGKKLPRTKNKYCVTHSTLMKEKKIHNSKSSKNDDKSTNILNNKQQLLLPTHIIKNDTKLASKSNNIHNNKSTNTINSCDIDNNHVSTSFVVDEFKIDDQNHHIGEISNRSILFNDNNSCDNSIKMGYCDNQLPLKPHLLLNDTNNPTEKSYTPYISTPNNIVVNNINRNVINPFHDNNNNTNNNNNCNQLYENYVVDQLIQDLDTTTTIGATIQPSNNFNNNLIQPNCYINSVPNFYPQHNQPHTFINNNKPSDISILARKSDDHKCNVFKKEPHNGYY